MIMGSPLKPGTRRFLNVIMQRMLRSFNYGGTALPGFRITTLKYN